MEGGGGIFIGDYFGRVTDKGTEFFSVYIFFLSLFL